MPLQFAWLKVHFDELVEKWFRKQKIYLCLGFLLRRPLGEDLLWDGLWVTVCERRKIAWREIASHRLLAARMMAYWCGWIIAKSRRDGLAQICDEERALFGGCQRHFSRKFLVHRSPRFRFTQAILKKFSARHISTRSCQPEISASQPNDSTKVLPYEPHKLWTSRQLINV